MQDQYYERYVNIDRRERIETGSGASIGFDDRARILLEEADGSATAFQLCEPFQLSPFVNYWIDRSRRYILLNGLGHLSVYCVDIDARRLFVAMNLYREPFGDVGLQGLGFVEHGELLLIIYERGVCCFDPDLRCRWKVELAWLNDHFARIEADVVWFENEHEGAKGFRLTDGTRASGSQDPPSI